MPSDPTNPIQVIYTPELRYNLTALAKNYCSINNLSLVNKIVCFSNDVGLFCWTRSEQNSKIKLSYLELYKDKSLDCFLSWGINELIFGYFGLFE